jgi:hypothetical protein
MALTQTLETLFVLPLDLMQPLPSLKKAIEKNDEVFIQANRQQMDRGLTSKSKSIGRYKRFSYKDRFEPVDLLKEGPFRGKMTVQVSDTETEIFSQDIKNDKLVAKYGEDIFGVPRELLPTVADALKEDFISDVRRKLFKK